MTLQMADSIIPENLPGAYSIFLVYVDGLWKTEAPVRAMHPHARLLTMTVLGGGAKAQGCDREAGDLTAGQAAEWLHLSIIAGQWRPVLYASRDNVPEVLGLLGDAHVGRSQIRILSAHYGAGKHICSPSACGAAFTADGTQWTNTAPGVGGTAIDLSILLDDFFGVIPTMDAIPLNILGSYTNNAGDLFVIGTDKNGVLHESKRTASGTWTAPYAIAGKTGA